MKRRTWPKSWLTETPGKRCPRCGHLAGRPIVLGMPAEELSMALHDGTIDIVLGGCIVGDDDPKYECRNCEVTFG